MKIWRCNVTCRGQFPAHNKILRRIIDQVEEAGTVVKIHGVGRQGRPGNQYRYLAFLQLIENLKMCIGPLNRVSTHS